MSKDKDTAIEHNTTPRTSLTSDQSEESKNIIRNTPEQSARARANIKKLRNKIVVNSFINKLKHGSIASKVSVEKFNYRDDEGINELKKIIFLINGVVKHDELKPLELVLNDKNLDAVASTFVRLILGNDLFKAINRIVVISKDPENRKILIDSFLRLVVEKNPAFVRDIITNTINNNQVQRIIEKKNHEAEFILLETKKKLEKLINFAEDSKLNLDVQQITAELRSLDAMVPKNFMLSTKKIFDTTLESLHLKTKKADSSSNLESLKYNLDSFLNVRSSEYASEAIEYIRKDFLQVLKINQKYRHAPLRDMLEEYFAFRDEITNGNEKSGKDLLILRNLIKKAISFVSKDEMLNLFDEISKRPKITLNGSSNIYNIVKAFIDLVEPKRFETLFNTLTGEEGLIKILSASIIMKPLEISPEMHSRLNNILAREVSAEQIEQIEALFNKKRSYYFSAEEIDKLNKILNVDLEIEQIKSLEKNFANSLITLELDSEQREAFENIAKTGLIFSRYFAIEFFSDEESRNTLLDFAKSIDVYTTIKSIRQNKISNKLINAKHEENITKNFDILFQKITHSIEKLLTRDQFNAHPDYINNLNNNVLTKVKNILPIIYEELKPEIKQLLLLNINKSLYQDDQTREIELIIKEQKILSDRILEKLINSNILQNRDFKDILNKILDNESVQKLISKDPRIVNFLKDLTPILLDSSIPQEMLKRFFPLIEEFSKLDPNDNQKPNLLIPQAILNNLSEESYFENAKFKALLIRIVRQDSFAPFLSAKPIMQKIMRDGIIGAIKSDLFGKMVIAANNHPRKGKSLFDLIGNFVDFIQKDEYQEYIKLSLKLGYGLPLEENEIKIDKTSKKKETIFHQIDSDSENLAKAFFMQAQDLCTSIEKPLVKTYNSFYKGFERYLLDNNQKNIQILSKEFNKLKEELFKIGIAPEKIETFEKKIINGELNKNDLEILKKEIKPSFDVTDNMAIIENQQNLIESLQGSDFFKNLSLMMLKSQTHLFASKESSEAMGKITEFFAKKAISSGLVNGFIKQLIEEESKNQDQSAQKTPNLIHFMKEYIKIEAIRDLSLKDEIYKKFNKQIEKYIGPKFGLYAVSHKDFMQEVNNDRKTIDALLKEVPDLRVAWGAWIGLSVVKVVSNINTAIDYISPMVSGSSKSNNSNSTKKINTGIG